MNIYDKQFGRQVIKNEYNLGLDDKSKKND